MHDLVAWGDWRPDTHSERVDRVGVVATELDAALTAVATVHHPYRRSFEWEGYTSGVAAGTRVSLRRYGSERSLDAAKAAAVEAAEITAAIAARLRGPTKRPALFEHLHRSD